MSQFTSVSQLADQYQMSETALKLLGSVSTWIVAIALVASSHASDHVLLAANGDFQWRRGNLHTHSHWSDGDDYLESIAVWYREHGYDFLAFTDHNTLAAGDRWVDVAKTKGGRKAFDKLNVNFPGWVDKRTKDGKTEVRLRQFGEVAGRLSEPGEFLLIQGEEISDRFEDAAVHLNASNVTEVIDPQGGRDVLEVLQNNVRAVVAQRKVTGQPMFVHVNHPNFDYRIGVDDLMRVQGTLFFEVYSGYPTANNNGDAAHPSVERMWDIALAHRLALFDLPLMYGLAVDDAHNYHTISSQLSNPGRGWVMVLTASLTIKDLFDSLEAGRFYASSGVTLKSVESSSKGLALEVDAKPNENYSIEFVGTRKSVNLEGEPAVNFPSKSFSGGGHGDEIGEVFKSLQGTRGDYQFTGNELYVRARVRSIELHLNSSEAGDCKQAWVQPVIGPGMQFAHPHQ